MSFRDINGRFSSDKPEWRVRKPAKEHSQCLKLNSKTSTAQDGVFNEDCKEGRRVVELLTMLTLITNLKFCSACRLGPVPLTMHSLKADLQKGLGGYLYVQCQNLDCLHINKVAYGKHTMTAQWECHVLM